MVDDNQSMDGYSAALAYSMGIEEGLDSAYDSVNTLLSRIDNFWGHLQEFEKHRAGRNNNQPTSITEEVDSLNERYGIYKGDKHALGTSGDSLLRIKKAIESDNPQEVSLREKMGLLYNAKASFVESIQEKAGFNKDSVIRDPLSSWGARPLKDIPVPDEEVEKIENYLTEFRGYLVGQGVDPNDVLHNIDAREVAEFDADLIPSKTVSEFQHGPIRTQEKSLETVQVVENKAANSYYAQSRDVKKGRNDTVKAALDEVRARPQRNFNRNHPVKSVNIIK